MRVGGSSRLCPRDSSIRFLLEAGHVVADVWGLLGGGGEDLQLEELTMILSLAGNLKGAYAGAACGARQAQPEQAGAAMATRRLAAQTSPDGATEERRAETQLAARARPPKPKPAVSAGLQRQAAGAKKPA